jgi:putative PIN family toxin of toxin-antitoxin system
MKTPKNRVIIDTNLWISFLLTRDLSKFDKIIASNKVTIIFSQELLDEFVEITQRSKFRKYFDLEDVEELLIKIKNRASFIDVTSIATACRDVKDNFLLALAVDGNATHLITGDKDLLVLEKYGSTHVLTVNEYFTLK